MKNIPIEAAGTIAKKYDAPIVVVFGYDPATNRQHVTTFGRTKEECRMAARAGNDLKKHLGWPESQCNAQPDPIRVAGKPN